MQWLRQVINVKSASVGAEWREDQHLPRAVPRQVTKAFEVRCLNPVVCNLGFGVQPLPGNE